LGGVAPPGQYHHDVLTVGEPLMMGCEYGEQDERQISRVENTAFSAMNIPPSTSGTGGGLMLPPSGMNTAGGLSLNTMSGGGGGQMLSGHQQQQILENCKFIYIYISFKLKKIFFIFKLPINCSVILIFIHNNNNNNK
jgi:hypothetical protein